MREVSCRNDPSGAYTVLHAVPSINTRTLYAVALNSIAKRESRGSKTLWRGQGAERLGFLNQHAGAVCSRAQLNREKGVQRVEDPLAGAGQSPAGVQRQSLWRLLQKGIVMKKQKQSFVVLGLGRFGSSVARSLCELGHEVLAVDRDEKLVEAIAPDVTQAVQANAVDEDALAELGVQNFDAAIVAIGTDIRASILATVLLKEAGVPKILAKAVDDLHARVLYKVGADRVIFPERDMGQRVARSLVAPNILDLMALSDDDQIAELTLPTDWADKTIVELNIRRNFGVSVLGIHRGGKFLTSPGAETMLMAGDVLLVMGKKEAISAVQ